MKLTKEYDGPTKIWLYFIECRGGGIYVGITQDMRQRYAEHCAGRAATYTRINPPIRLLARIAYPCRLDAIRAEREFKTLPAAKKRRFAAALRGDFWDTMGVES